MYFWGGCSLEGWEGSAAAAALLDWGVGCFLTLAVPEEEVVAAGAVVVVAADEEAVLSVPLFDEDEAEAGMLEDFFLAAKI